MPVLYHPTGNQNAFDKFGISRGQPKLVLRIALEVITQLTKYKSRNELTTTGPW